MDLKGDWSFSSSSSYSCSSSCTLFEASGDSEGDFDPNMGGGYVDDDKDDAMSCSYDRSEYSSCNVAAADNGHEEHDEDDGDDVMKKKEDKDGVYGSLCCEEEEDDDDDEILPQEKYKSFVSFDSNQEFVDEKEKNRLFWEACLAS